MLNHDNISLEKWAAPLFKTPFTDVLFNTRNLQCLKECAHYELQLADCMEAYGYHRGKEKCRLILEDMYECAMKIKRGRRFFAMHAERERQFKNGERKEQYTENPPLDLF